MRNTRIVIRMPVKAVCSQCGEPLNVEPGELSLDENNVCTIQVEPHQCAEGK